jgi:hypothetical protein
MVSTGIQTYGSNGTGTVSGSSWSKSCPYRDCRNQVLPNKEDGYAVKAILAHDAITHPDHPLRIAGKQGIELFIGELATCCYPLCYVPNGQSHFPFRYPGKWRSPPFVLFRTSRIHPLLVAHNGLHKGAYSAPIF